MKVEISKFLLCWSFYSYFSHFICLLRGNLHVFMYFFLIYLLFSNVLTFSYFAVSWINAFQFNFQMLWFKSFQLLKILDKKPKSEEKKNIEPKPLVILSWVHWGMGHVWQYSSKYAKYRLPMQWNNLSKCFRQIVLYSRLLKK